MLEVKETEETNQGRCLARIFLHWQVQPGVSRATNTSGLRVDLHLVLKSLHRTIVC